MRQRQSSLTGRRPICLGAGQHRPHLAARSLAAALAAALASAPLASASSAASSCSLGSASPASLGDR